MRILYCADTYPPQVNGVSVVTHLAVSGLLARGHPIGVVTPRYPAEGPRSVFDADGALVVAAVPSVPMPGYPEIRLAFPAYRRVLRGAARFQPDLIHCATEGVLGRLGQLVARKLGVPVVTSYHTDFSRYMTAYGADWLAAPTRSYLTRFHNRATLTLTPSHAAVAQLRLMGVGRTIVWGAGVDAVSYRPDRRSPALRQKLGLEGKFTFLHIGRLAPEKNLDLLIRAFARCRELVGPDRATLVIAGDGPLRAELERSAPPGIRFLGYLDRGTDLPELYASADAFVFSSETETLGLVILEAMASGLPVVAAPAAGVGAYLRHGVNGLAYPPGDKEAMAGFMADLVTEPALRDSLAEGARRTAESLGWDRELDRLVRIYENVGSSAWPPPITAEHAIANERTGSFRITAGSRREGLRGT
jgi:glycosyltransferase involved in cell wall biosynthesis